MRQDLMVEYECRGICNDEQTKTEVGSQAVSFVEEVRDGGPCADMCHTNASVTVQEDTPSPTRRKRSNSLVMLCINLEREVNEMATEEEIENDGRDMASLLTWIARAIDRFHLNVPGRSFVQVAVELGEAVGICSEGYTQEDEHPFSCGEYPLFSG